MGNVISNVTTWSACQQHCADEPMCEYWTLNVNGECQLLSNVIGRAELVGAKSGNKDCKGEDCLLVGWFAVKNHLIVHLI